MTNFVFIYLFMIYYAEYLAVFSQNSYVQRYIEITEKISSDVVFFIFFANAITKKNKRKNRFNCFVHVGPFFSFNKLEKTFNVMQLIDDHSKIRKLELLFDQSSLIDFILKQILIQYKNYYKT